MKIERFDAIDARSGMREINAKYGDDVLIISNSRLAGKNRFVIAVNDTATPMPDATAVKTKADRQDSAALKELQRLMDSRFESLKGDLMLVRRNQASLYHLTQGKNTAAAASEHKLLQLLANTTVPVNLLHRLQKITARCSKQSDIVQAVRIFLSRQLPETVMLADTPTTHILVGSHGVGKSLSAMRMGAMINAQADKSAVVVGYKSTKDGARAQLQILGEKAGVRIDFANDCETLLSIINRHMGASSVIVDVPGDLPASELYNLSQCLPLAEFHLVMAKDNNQHDLQFCKKEYGLTFSSAIITRMDCQGAYWPLIHSLMEHKIPLLFGGHSASVHQPFVSLDKKLLVKEAVHSMMLNSANDQNTTASINSLERENRFPYTQTQV